MAWDELAARVRGPRDLAPLLDHTLLAQGATAAQVVRLCDEARRHGFAAACVRAEHAEVARGRLQGSRVRLALVADFPRGEGTTAARVAEAVAAARLGADELDLVAPLPLLAAGRWAAALEDLQAVIEAARLPVKVILETAALPDDAIVAAAAVARAAGAAMLKTSTGFGPGGATEAAVALLRRVAGEALGVKASGGIRTASQALAMVRAGASRIGASASVAIVEGSLEG
jgi:deoxyribose-phosphate aldolase